MTWVYLAFLIFGGGLLAPMVLGGFANNDLDFDGGDLDIDLELDPNVDVPGDLEVVGVAGDGPVAAIFDGLLSFRSLVFFAAFFGGGGLLIGVFGYGALATLLGALTIGVGASVVHSTLFGLVVSSSAESLVSERHYVGRIGTVTVPVGAGHRGRVRLSFEGQPQLLSAEPFDVRAGEQFDVGASVVVVEMERGIARVSSLAELGLGEEEG